MEGVRSATRENDPLSMIAQQNEAVKRSIERARGEKALKDQLADKRAENEAKTLEYYKKSKDVKAKMAFIQENLGN